MMKPFYCVDRMVRFSLLVTALGWARLIRVARLLLLSCLEHHLLDQGVSVGDGKHLLRHPGVVHGELLDQGRVPESLFEEHHDWLVINLHDSSPLVAEMLDVFSKGLLSSEQH
jgi:hypothetical protein